MAIDPDSKEEWLPVVGYEDSYEVSNFGRVRSIERQVINRLGRSRIIKARNMKTLVARNGYEMIDLSKNGTKRRFSVHRLVAMAFKPTEREGVEVMHLDHNRLNNHVSNLEWGTHKENALTSVKAGRYFNQRKTRCPRGHEYSGVNKQGYRVCPRCNRESQRRRDARKKEEEMQRLHSREYSDEP